MDKYSVMAKLYDEEIFDDSISLMITIEKGQLEITPYGGTFTNQDIDISREAYGLSKHLLDSFNTYGGVKDTGVSDFVNPKEKH